MQTLDVTQILAVMDTLLTVSHRECEPLSEPGNSNSQKSTDACSSTEKDSDKLSYLVRLLCSLQASLLVWCSEQVDAEGSEMSPTAQTLVLQCMSFSLHYTSSVVCDRKKINLSILCPCNS